MSISLRLGSQRKTVCIVHFRIALITAVEISAVTIEKKNEMSVYV